MASPNSPDENSPDSSDFALLLGAEIDRDATTARILDAALALFADIGISRVSADDIARQAGVNRATLYRRVGAKDVIVRAALLRETARVLEQISTRLRHLDPADPEAAAERVTLGFATTVTLLRTNPILMKLLAVDRDQTLAAITVGAGDILALATAFVAEELFATTGAVRDPRTVAGMIVRLVHSLILTPDAPPRLRDEPELRAFAAGYLVPVLLPRHPDTK
ncbi:TetR/AcrR family transcriptional regulator [Nocardia higoensis]|uniref:TetR/AcrR family transcriptional regulator n=1 Tax=Nocardia higoensis TaxID=228599 RepID=UPI00030A2BF7|nr:TetR/AcrR family transcriptional regulator [Nocardia higoensis]